MSTQSMARILFYACIILQACPCDSFGDESKVDANYSFQNPEMPLVIMLKGKVFQEMVEEHRADDITNSYGLYCLVGEDGYPEKHLNDLFTNSTIRVEFTTDNLSQTNNFIFDKLTKKPAKQFWVSVRSVSKNSAVIDGGWFNGRRASQVVRYKFVNKDGIWKIVSRKTVMVS